MKARTSWPAMEASSADSLTRTAICVMIFCFAHIFITAIQSSFNTSSSRSTNYDYLCTLSVCGCDPPMLPVYNYQRTAGLFPGLLPVLSLALLAISFLCIIYAKQTEKNRINRLKTPDLRINNSPNKWKEETSHGNAPKVSNNISLRNWNALGVVNDLLSEEKQHWDFAGNQEPEPTFRVRVIYEILK